MRFWERQGMITTMQMTWSFLLGAMNTVSCPASAVCLSLISFVTCAKPFTVIGKGFFFQGHAGILPSHDRLSQLALTWEAEICRIHSNQELCAVFLNWQILCLGTGWLRVKWDQKIGTQNYSPSALRVLLICHSSWGLAISLGSRVSQEAQLTQTPRESIIWFTYLYN